MPELPEVETCRLGLIPHLLHQVIHATVLRETRMRWPVPKLLPQYLNGQTIQDITRRGKYLLFTFANGTLLIHLGMSGTLRLIDANTPLKKHDHVQFTLQNNLQLRYHDPRRFGAVLFTTDNPLQHPLLCELGPEPLTAGFCGKHLQSAVKNRKTAVKLYIMDSTIVVGVGNIYANEALFQAGINPLQAVNTLLVADWNRLAKEIKLVLKAAIAKGGTTLRDFLSHDGKPGYFQQTLSVYGRGGLPCVNCCMPLTEIRIGQRSSVFCARCQAIVNI